MLDNSRIPKKYFKIRDKILISFLAVALISVGIISVFAFRNMSMVANTAKSNSIVLGETAVAEGIAALEDSGRNIIQLKAKLVANEFQIYWYAHSDRTRQALLDTPELANIAVQTVGQTGYTMVYGRDDVIYFNADPRIVGTNINDLTANLLAFRKLLKTGDTGESAGYYDMEDASGNIRSRYAYCVPVTGTDFTVVATTYIDEFSRPATETESKITAAVSQTTQYINSQMDLAQWTFGAIIACMVIIIIVLTTYISRSITNPITALTKGSEVIAKGNLDFKINVKTGDEVEKLSQQFNSMTSALKESYNNLDQKVKERTRELSQKAGQLYTINEISRKISSIINLDELLPFVTNLLKQTFHYDNVNVFLFEGNQGKLILKEICLSGFSGVIPLDDVPLEMGEEGIVGWVAQTGEPLLANDVTKEPKYQFVEELSDTKSELAVPIKVGEKILGVLDIESNEIDAFNEADLSNAQTLADHLAIAIENARLYKETGQMAIMEERNRIAREIHDTLAQGFTGIILQLEAVEQALEQGKPESVTSHLNKARSLARGSLSEARRSVWNLRPEALEKMRLPDAIKQEVTRFSQTNNIKASFDFSGDSQELRPDTETAILRISQEALANIRKHAKATEVKVKLDYDKSDVILTVSDNGQGFATESVSDNAVKRKGFGLISMRERARNAGGNFNVESEVGQGTIVKVTLPAG